MPRRRLRRPRQLRLFALCVATIAVAAAGASAAGSPAPAASAACKAGIKTIGGHQARVFCGPARATVQVGGKTYTLKGGLCGHTGPFVVNIGTIVIGVTGNNGLPYFGLLASTATKDGVYSKDVVLSFRYGGKGWVVGGTKLTLKKGRTAGSFTGTAIGGGPAKGSFTC